jgi:hypothetical protein
MNKRLQSLLLSGIVVASMSAQAEVPYPEGYRDWHHVKSMVINPGHALYDAFGGIHHLYANALAEQGYATGTFADGSVIVFDLLETEAKDNAVHEGKRKVLGVMHKDAQRYEATGGWGFEGFAGGDPSKPVVGAEAATACYACHTSQAGSDYVFSRPRQ